MPSEDGPRPLELPPLSDTVAWARMLAAARGADMIKTDGFEAINADPLTMKRLDTLLPIALTLCDALVGPTALAESKRMDDIWAHCRKGPRAMADDKSMVMERWDQKRCWSEAQGLLVPQTPMSVRRTEPVVISLYMIPQCSAWLLLRYAINRHLSYNQQSQMKHYLRASDQGAYRGLLERGAEVQTLRNASFVNAVFQVAPPLVRYLPPRWTSPYLTDNLLEALQALVGLGNTRHLAKLVELLSDAERALLIEELWCLSVVLGKREWTSDCAKERSLDDYEKFVQVLRRDAYFKDSLDNVLSSVPAVKGPRRETKTLSSSGPAPLAPSTTHPAMVRSESGSGSDQQSNSWRYTLTTGSPTFGAAAKRQRAGDPQAVVSLQVNNAVIPLGPLELLSGGAAKRARTSGESLDTDQLVEQKATFEPEMSLKVAEPDNEDEPLGLDEFGDDELPKVPSLRGLADLEASGAEDGLWKLPLESIWEYGRPHGAESDFPEMDTFVAQDLEGIMQPERPVSRVGRMLARGDRVTAAPSFSILALAALVLCIVALVFRFRRSQALTLQRFYTAL